MGGQPGPRRPGTGSSHWPHRASESVWQLLRSSRSKPWAQGQSGQDAGCGLFIRHSSFIYRLLVGGAEELQPQGRAEPQRHPRPPPQQGPLTTERASVHHHPGKRSSLPAGWGSGAAGEGRGRESGPRCYTGARPLRTPALGRRLWRPTLTPAPSTRRWWGRGLRDPVALQSRQGLQIKLASPRGTWQRMVCSVSVPQTEPGECL